MGGVTHGMFGTPEYRAYRNALNRCRRESDPRFGSYGGRGIEMRFDTFEEFFCCVGLRPNRKYSLDRIDTNGHYEAGNVRWATAAQQVASKTTTTIYTHLGRSMTLGQWCKETGVPYKKAWRRLNTGWSFPRSVGLE